MVVVIVGLTVVGLSKYTSCHSPPCIDDIKTHPHLSLSPYLSLYVERYIHFLKYLGADSLC
jgi:hypothetical protein